MMNAAAVLAALKEAGPFAIYVPPHQAKGSAVRLVDLPIGGQLLIVDTSKLGNVLVLPPSEAHENAEAARLFLKVGEEREAAKQGAS